MNLLNFSANIADFRQSHKIRHLSTDIVFITLAAIICGAEDWEDVEGFGHCKLRFFKKHLELPNGIPSHDTFNRFFSMLDPKVMEKQFRIWVKTICSECPTLVSVDGKTIRGAKSGGKSIFHMVSAFCHANGVSLGQIQTAEKSNEITAIPELIKVLDIAGCIVSIDAMGCQSGIVDDILAAKADYLLAVKGNQVELYQALEDTFRFQSNNHISFFEDLDFGHGRIEERQCYVSNNLEFVNREKWNGVQTLVKIISKRYNKTKQKQEETTIRYYISSAVDTPERFCSLVRSHWSIENNLHWMLDCVMGEDASRKRMKNSPINFSVVAKTALAILKKYNPRKKRISIKTKRKMGGWSDECLSDMLAIDPA